MLSVFKFLLVGMVAALLLPNQRVYGQALLPFENENGWSLKDAKGLVVLDNLNMIQPPQNNLYVVSQNNKWGAVNAQSRLTIPIIYDELVFLTTNVFRAKRQQTYLLLDSLGNNHLPEKVYGAEALKNSDHLVIKDKHGQWGLIDQNGKAITKITYANPPDHLLGSDLAVVKKIDDGYYTGVINKTGQTVVPHQYLFIDNYQGKYYRCQHPNGSVAYYSQSGTKLHESRMENIRFIDTNCLVIDYDTIQQLILKESSQTFLAKEWRTAKNFYSGVGQNDSTIFVDAKRQSFQLKGKWYLNESNSDHIKVRGPDGSGLWSDSGDEILAPKYARLWDWNQDYAIVKKTNNDRQMALIDLKTGQEALSRTYESITFLPCRQVLLKQKDTVVILDKNLTAVTNDETGENLYFWIPNDDKIKLKRTYAYKSAGGNYDVIAVGQTEDCTDKKLILEKANNFELLKDLYGENPIPNRIKVRTYENANKSGLLDFNGKVIAPLEYHYIGAHFGKFIIMSQAGSGAQEGQLVYGLMDVNGKVLIAPKYDEIKRLYNGVAITILDGVYNLLDPETNQELTAGYDRIITFENGLLLVQKNRKNGLINSLGQPLTDLKYDNIYFDQNTNIYTAKREGSLYRLDINGNEYPWHENN